MNDKAESEVYLPMTEQNQSLPPPKPTSFKTSRSSAPGAIKGHRASTQSNMSEKAIMYEGVEITSYDDLIKNFRLDSFEETMAKKG